MRAAWRLALACYYTQLQQQGEGDGAAVISCHLKIDCGMFYIFTVAFNTPNEVV